jgi:hypothetical protein
MSCQIVSFNTYSSTTTSYKEQIKEDKKLIHNIHYDPKPSKQNLNQTKAADSPLVFIFLLFILEKTKQKSFAFKSTKAHRLYTPKERSQHYRICIKIKRGSEFILRVQNKNLRKINKYIYIDIPE